MTVNGTEYRKKVPGESGVRDGDQHCRVVDGPSGLGGVRAQVALHLRRPAERLTGLLRAVFPTLANPYRLMCCSAGRRVGDEEAVTVIEVIPVGNGDGGLDGEDPVDRC